MSEVTQTERGSCTSASNAAADALCPARYKRQQGLPDERGRYSDSGTRVHEWLAGKDVELTTEEMDVAEAAATIECRILAEQFGILLSESELRGKVEPTEPLGGKVEIYREKRFWLEWVNDRKPGLLNLRHSGQLDLLGVFGDRGFISERKSLWGDVPESARNLQVRDQVVLAFANIPGLIEIIAIVNQPRITHKPEAVLYTLHDFDRALSETMQRVAASHLPHAKAVPGEVQCKYCRAKKMCPEFLIASMPPARIDGDQMPVKQHFECSIAKLNGKQLGEFLPMVRLCAEVLENETRRRLSAGEPVDGWKLSPGRIIEKIADPQLVFERFIALGGDTAAFMPAVTVGKSKLSEALRGLTGKGGMALKKEMARLLEGATEGKQSSEILERDNH